MTDPDGMASWAKAQLAWQAERNYAERTRRQHEAHLRYFLAWAEARSLSRPGEVTRAILERYQRHLFWHRKKDGRPLSWVSQSSRLGSVRGYFRWLVRQGVLPANPAADLILPRREHRLPKAILSEEEVERVLVVPDVTTALGLRDRAMLEVLYATGMRRSELTSLTVDGIDRARCVVWIRQGKGNKDRVVPLGTRALDWVERYLGEARRELECGRDEGTLFLSAVGEALSAAYLTHRVRELLNAARIQKPGSCHLFRHTMATLMLEGGADIRSVQEMLGHESLTTTQIYTRVSVQRLAAVHAATHPGLRPRSASGAPEAKVELDDDAATDEALVSSFAAEAAEEDADG